MAHQEPARSIYEAGRRLAAYRRSWPEQDSPRVRQALRFATECRAWLDRLSKPYLVADPQRLQMFLRTVEAFLTDHQPRTAIAGPSGRPASNPAEPTLSASAALPS